MDSKNLLIKYMVESFEQEHVQKSQKKEGGPFITISREHGCMGNTFAIMLRDELAKMGYSWRIMNKEIIQESAKELNMDPHKVMNISQTDRTQMDEVLNSLSTRYYKSDKKIMKAISSVVLSTANEGNAIIVGRGGVVTTNGMQPSIQLKLYAPVEWRLQSLMERYHAKREHMLSEITTIDHKRHKLTMDAMKGYENIDDYYDLQINCSTINQKQMVAMIIKLMEERNMLVK